MLLYTENLLRHIDYLIREKEQKEESLCSILQKCTEEEKYHNNKIQRCQIKHLSTRERYSSNETSIVSSSIKQTG